MKTYKKLLTLFISLILLAAVFVPVYADELKEHQQRLEEVSRQIDLQKDKINQVQKKENTVMGQIQDLEQNIYKTEKELNSLDSRISYLEENIKGTEEEIAKLEEELVEQTEILSNRLVLIYEEGQVSYLKVLLSATDIKDFLIHYEMLNSIVQQDVELIESINKKKQELNIRKSDLEVKKKELESILEEQESKKRELDAQRKQKEEILKQVKQQKDSYLKALEELEKTSRQLEEMIKNLQSGGGDTQLGTGVYTWPTPGYRTITSPYGMRYHPILKTRKMHTGVDIGAPMGATIVAADSGKVIYAGWMGGYGQVLVINHGNGISTLYAHQSSFIVGNGATVTKGQAIGRVGSTGWSTGPHLHFEVRKQGSPVDPMDYIK